MDPSDLEYLIGLGVDGFGIVDTGHPNISPVLQAAMVNAQKRYGVILTADTNWHGWSGFLNAWNVITPGPHTGTRRDAVLSVLRGHEYERVTPVVAGPVHTPPLARALLAPFAESIRYGLEITTAQFLSWWAWILLLVGLAAMLTRAGYPAARCLTAAGLLVLGGGLTLKGSDLTWVWLSSPSPYDFSLRFALLGIGVGVIALALSLFLILSALRGRTAPRDTRRADAE